MDKLTIEIIWVDSGQKCVARAFKNNKEIGSAEAEENIRGREDWYTTFGFPIEQYLIIESIKKLLGKMYPKASEYCKVVSMVKK